MTINDLLCLFWKWIGLSPDEYAVYSEKMDLEEYMFPLWEELISNAKDIVDKQQDGRLSLSCVLTVLAFDNEDEELLEYIVNNGNDAFTCQLVILGSQFYLAHARWQCAEIIRRRNLKALVYILKGMLNDSNGYVAKRAGNALDSMCSFDERNNDNQ